VSGVAISTWYARVIRRKGHCSLHTDLRECPVIELRTGIIGTAGRVKDLHILKSARKSRGAMIVSLESIV